MLQLWVLYSRQLPEAQAAVRQLRVRLGVLERQVREGQLDTSDLDSQVARQRLDQVPQLHRHLSRPVPAVGCSQVLQHVGLLYSLHCGDCPDPHLLGFSDFVLQLRAKWLVREGLTLSRQQKPPQPQQPQKGITE